MLDGHLNHLGIKKSMSPSTSQGNTHTHNSVSYSARIAVRVNQAALCLCGQDLNPYTGGMEHSL